MSQIFDTLFIKRFCLPSNTDISSYELGNTSVPACLCGNFNHVSCLLQGKQCFEKG